MEDLETIDLTLRIICEPADAARFVLSPEAMRATCRCGGTDAKRPFSYSPVCHCLA
jgi:hypothetical protein